MLSDKWILFWIFCQNLPSSDGKQPYDEVQPYGSNTMHTGYFFFQMSQNSCQILLKNQLESGRWFRTQSAVLIQIKVRKFSLVDKFWLILVNNNCFPKKLISNLTNFNINYDGRVFVCITSLLNFTIKFWNFTNFLTTVNM